MHAPLENVEWADKYEGERRRYILDWTDALATGDTIDGTPTVVLLYGDAVIEGVAFLSPNTTLFISGGTVGAQAVKLRAETTDGEEIEAVATFRVL